MAFDHGKDAWDALEAKFGVSDAGTESYVMEQYYDYRMTDERSAVEQVHEIQSLAKELEFLIVKSEVSDMHVGTIMESNDATFFEDIFPMKETSSSSTQEMPSSSTQELFPEPTMAIEHSENPVEDDNEPPKRSKRQRTVKSFVHDFIVYLVDDTPTSILEAYASLDADYWKEAVRSEMDSILANGTWEVTDRPYGCKPVGCKWVFKKKLRPDGTIEKYKARLVAKGYTQRRPPNPASREPVRVRGNQVFGERSGATTGSTTSSSDDEFLHTDNFFPDLNDFFDNLNMGDNDAAAKWKRIAKHSCRYQNELRQICDGDAQRDAERACARHGAPANGAGSRRHGRRAGRRLAAHVCARAASTRGLARRAVTTAAAPLLAACRAIAELARAQARAAAATAAPSPPRHAAPPCRAAAQPRRAATHATAPRRPRPRARAPPCVLAAAQRGELAVLATTGGAASRPPRRPRMPRNGRAAALIGFTHNLVHILGPPRLAISPRPAACRRRPRRPAPLSLTDWWQVGGREGAELLERGDPATRAEQACDQLARGGAAAAEVVDEVGGVALPSSVARACAATSSSSPVKAVMN
ncbi:hypothetical protein QYE76_024608 [Lolium multiflorum]|uniref:Reverse transcriptase Ty1/copia-type domain-containing protein n=1 Tax=Lolium multiflorum TaxID=4521 RepID=A0AAD8RE85_LOLMU|nr:hypothetical protein QYE76_024608 [Lolium multiflorum]